MAENSNQLIIDTHAHTSRIAPFWPSEYVPYDPAELVAEVARQRDGALLSGKTSQEAIGGIALTGHDTFSGVKEAIEAGEERGIIVTPGVEITSRPGKRGPTGIHLIVLMPVEVGLKLEKKRTILPTFRSRKKVADWAHSHGGVVIAPHAKPKGDNVSLSYKQLRKDAGLFDGMETAFRCGLDKVQELEELADELKLASIGASDAHKLGHVGMIGTRVYGLPDIPHSDDILLAIKEGRTEAVVLRGVNEKEDTEGAIISHLKRMGDHRSKRKQNHEPEKVAA